MTVVVIGGGPAGMMAGITAAERGKKVVLIEKNDKLGKKLYITGKGRCNLTNTALPDEFIASVPNNPKFLISALNLFSPQDTAVYFENAGLPLKTERGGRIFPVSDKASDVTAALLRKLNRYNVDIRLGERVLDIEFSCGRAVKVVTNKCSFAAESVIIATGGCSYPSTGSTGDGYGFAITAGHSVVTPRSALAPIYLNGVYDYSDTLINVQDLPLPAGLSLVNISAGIKEKGRKKLIASEFGELLFTHKGVSGPVILTLSSLINKKNLSYLRLAIDLKPALSNELLDKRILRDFSQVANKQFKNSLADLLPKSLIPFIIQISGIDPDIFVHSITKEERLNLVALLKSLEFSILSLGSLNEAIVTAGGIAVRELEPSTLRSKLIENLYFAGEIIDVDGLTGGYNLQIAFSTGRLAGKSV